MKSISLSFNDKKEILVYGNSKDDIIDRIIVDKIESGVKWRNMGFPVYAEDGYDALNPVPGDHVSNYDGPYYIWYDD